MWQNIVNGLLGLWVIALAFLAFSVSMQRVLLVVTGLAITLVAFLGRVFIKPTRDLVKYAEEEKKEAVSDVKPIF